MRAKNKPSYEELERRNDSLARQIIGYQLRGAESLSSIIRKAKAAAWEEGYDAGQGDGHTGITANNLNPYEAAPVEAKPTAEGLLDTRAGLALANKTFQEGMSAGIMACNDSLEGEPFVKPISPYSAPLLALIKADKESLDHSPCCSSHGEPMTCERYRRTHFVEVRPCCTVDAERLEQEKAAQL